VGDPKPPGYLGGEESLLRTIAEILTRALGPAPNGELWSGDDAAVVRLAGAVPNPLLLTVDAVVEGVHVDLGYGTAEDLGWKAIAVAVSDIAAMGGQADRAVVALGGPPGTDVRAIVTGMAAASTEWNCPLVGGDLTEAPVIVVSTTVVGTLGDGPPAVTRAGARPGDTLFVTGPLGASAAGLRVLRQATGSIATWTPPDAETAALVSAYRRPRARLAEGWTARHTGVSAMLDCSDGLALDLHRLADASGVGFQLETVPVAQGAAEAEALGGGEDYELILATPEPEALIASFAAAGHRVPVRIGMCGTDVNERRLQSKELPALGWQHDL
jgi:thiamine-monophosphate kinase